MFIHNYFLLVFVIPHRLLFPIIPEIHLRVQGLEMISRREPEESHEIGKQRKPRIGAKTTFVWSVKQSRAHENTRPIFFYYVTYLSADSEVNFTCTPFHQFVNN